MYLAKNHPMYSEPLELLCMIGRVNDKWEAQVKDVITDLRIVSQASLRGVIADLEAKHSIYVRIYTVGKIKVVGVEPEDYAKAQQLAKAYWHSVYIAGDKTAKVKSKRKPMPSNGVGLTMDRASEILGLGGGR